eukprot:16374_1
MKTSVSNYYLFKTFCLSTMPLSSVVDLLRNVVTPEMDHSVIESVPFLWTTRVVDIVSTLIVGLLLCTHLYSMICTSDGAASQSTMRVVGSQLQKWTKILAMFSILFVLSQFILMLFLSFNIWAVLPTSLSCDTIVFSLVWIYHLSKSFFYCVFITRLQVAFRASSFKYSTCTIVSLYVFVVIYTIFVCIGTSFLIFGVWLHTPVAWCHIHTHDTTASSIAIAVWIVMDVVISVILCGLFMRPIKRVLQLSDDQPNSRFAALYIKYGLLTYISIILNLVSLLFYLFDHLTIMIEITAAVNSICIILMYARYQSIFNYFCGCIVVCCMRKKKRISNDVDTFNNTKYDMELSALKRNMDEDDLENADDL